MDIDIALVGETHWRAGDVFTIPNYTTYKYIRDGRGGGTAVFIKSNIEHYQVNITQQVTLESTVVMVYTSTIGKLKIAACYFPPNRVFNDDDYEGLMTGNTPTLLAGDLNAKNTL